MIIEDKSDIDSLLKNKLSLKDSGKGFQVERFTSAQTRFFNKNAALSAASKCSAGVCLDLITDAKKVSINYSILSEISKAGYFDIFINDCLINHHYKEASSKLDSIDINLSHYSSGKNRLTVYFPYNMEIILKSIEISEKAGFENIKGGYKRLLCLGDSITQGIEAGFPSFSFPVTISRSMNMEVLNQAVRGSSYDTETLDAQLSYRPNIIIIFFNNDSYRSDSEEFCEKIKKYLKRFHELYSYAKLYIVTPIFNPDKSGDLEELEKTLRETSILTNIQVVSGLEMVPHIKSYFNKTNNCPNHAGMMQFSINLLKKIQF